MTMPLTAVRRHLYVERDKQTSKRLQMREESRRRVICDVDFRLHKFTRSKASKRRNQPSQYHHTSQMTWIHRRVKSYITQIQDNELETFQLIRKTILLRSR